MENKTAKCNQKITKEREEIVDNDDSTSCDTCIYSSPKKMNTRPNLYARPPGHIARLSNKSRVSLVSLSKISF